MEQPLRLMCVLAHPDDESMGTGGILAKYAAEGVETSLICATRGERGWFGAPDEYPGMDELGRIREKELRAAAEVLGIGRVDLLDYVDGDLDQADHDEAVGRIVRLLREVRPQVVVTFAPDGGYGHPDHIAISQFATAATVVAADPCYRPDLGEPHRVAKLYYYVVTATLAKLYIAQFGEIVFPVDGVDRGMVLCPDWMATSRVDCGDEWSTVLAAIMCHASQLSTLSTLDDITEEFHRLMWSSSAYYRAYSLVNGGRAVEDDLFAGLRSKVEDGRQTL
ncbi:MAG: PIG-L deacetylase family protein [Thermomicrobiales bacterium]